MLELLNKHLLLNRNQFSLKRILPLPAGKIKLKIKTGPKPMHTALTNRTFNSLLELIRLKKIKPMLPGIDELKLTKKDLPS